MAEDTVVKMKETGADSGSASLADAPIVRIYEVGYHITPNAKEEDLDAVVGGIR